MDLLAQDSTHSAEAEAFHSDQAHTAGQEVFHTRQADHPQVHSEDRQDAQSRNSDSYEVAFRPVRHSALAVEDRSPAPHWVLSAAAPFLPVVHIPQALVRPRFDPA